MFAFFRALHFPCCCCCCCPPHPSKLAGVDYTCVALVSEFYFRQVQETCSLSVVHPRAHLFGALFHSLLFNHQISTIYDGPKQLLPGQQSEQWKMTKKSSRACQSLNSCSPPSLVLLTFYQHSLCWWFRSTRLVCTTQGYYRARHVGLFGFPLNSILHPPFAPKAKTFTKSYYRTYYPSLRLTC